MSNGTIYTYVMRDTECKGLSCKLGRTGNTRKRLASLRYMTGRPELVYLYVWKGDYEKHLKRLCDRWSEQYEYRVRFGEWFIPFSDVLSDIAQSMFMPNLIS